MTARGRFGVVTHSSDSIKLAADLVRAFRRAGHFAKTVENGCALEVWQRGTARRTAKDIPPETTLWLPDSGLGTGFIWGPQYEHAAHTRLPVVAVAALVAQTLPQPPARRRRKCTACSATV